MEDCTREQPDNRTIVTLALRAAALGLLVNSLLCLAFPVLTDPDNWLPNITFGVIGVHVMGRLFSAFVERSRTISANTLGAALALLAPVAWLSNLR